MSSIVSLWREGELNAIEVLSATRGNHALTKQKPNQSRPQQIFVYVSYRLSSYLNLLHNCRRTIRGIILFKWDKNGKHQLMLDGLTVLGVSQTQGRISYEIRPILGHRWTVDPGVFYCSYNLIQLLMFVRMFKWESHLENIITSCEIRPRMGTL